MPSLPALALPPFAASSPVFAVASCSSAGASVRSKSTDLRYGARADIAEDDKQVAVLGDGNVARRADRVREDLGAEPGGKSQSSITAGAGPIRLRLK